MQARSGLRCCCVERLSSPLVPNDPVMENPASAENVAGQLEQFSALMQQFCKRAEYGRPRNNSLYV